MEAWLTMASPEINLAVQRDHAAGAHGDAVPGLYVAAAGQARSPCGVCSQTLSTFRDMARGQVRHGLLVGPLIQDIADAQQEHDGARGLEVAPQHGDADGGGVEHGHLNLPVQQAIESPALQVMHGAERR